MPVRTDINSEEKLSEFIARPASMSGTVVELLGNVGVGDGEGGLYRHDATDTTSAHNFPNVIVDNAGRRWKFVARRGADPGAIDPSEWADITDFGATTASTDNLDAFMDAVSASPLVYVPPGTFDIGAPGIGLPDGLTIRGASRHHSVLRWRNPESEDRTLMQTEYGGTTTSGSYVVPAGGGAVGILNVVDASSLPEYGQVRLYMTPTTVTTISYGYKVGNSLRDTWAATAGVTGTFPSGSAISSGPRLLKDFSIRDITLDGGVGTYITQGFGPGNSMFLVYGFEDLSFERVTARNSTGYGVGLEGGPPNEDSLSHHQKRSRRLWVDACLFINNGWNASGDPHDGFDVKWGEDVMISRTGAIGNADQGIDMRGRNLTEESCWAQGNGAEGFSYDSANFRDYRAVNSRTSSDTYIRISNATHITAGDIIKVGGTNEYMLVTHDPQPFVDAPDPLSYKQIKVRRGQMGSTAQSIGAGSFLTLMKIGNMRASHCDASNNGMMNWNIAGFSGNDGMVVPENFGMVQVNFNNCNSRANRGKGLGVYDALSGAIGRAQITVQGGDYSYNGSHAIYAEGSASGRGRRSLLVDRIRAQGNVGANGVQQSNWTGASIGVVDVPGL